MVIGHWSSRVFLREQHLATAPFGGPFLLLLLFVLARACIWSVKERDVLQPATPFAIFEDPPCVHVHECRFVRPACGAKILMFVCHLLCNCSAGVAAMIAMTAMTAMTARCATAKRHVAHLACLVPRIMRLREINHLCSTCIYFRQISQSNINVRFSIRSCEEPSLL